MKRKRLMKLKVELPNQKKKGKEEEKMIIEKTSLSKPIVIADDKMTIEAQKTNSTAMKTVGG